MVAIREPHVAGQFYAGTRESLIKQVESAFLHRLGPQELPQGEPEYMRNIKAIVSPHAGYIYSGHIAAHGYLELFKDGKPEHIVILGPNHTGIGEGVAISDLAWRTPLGIVEPDFEIIDELAEHHIFSIDNSAHAWEHSIEVQLPFLQYIFGDFQFTAICIKNINFEVVSIVGEVLADLSKEKDILVIASSDFTHFESAESARKKDMPAINLINNLDAAGFHSYVVQNNVSICGLGPITAALSFAKSSGATKGNLLKYANSGDVSGDHRNVVAYASIKIE